MNNRLDHIIWVCDDLERGMSRFESLTGVHASYGGTHASGLTHNALVGLGGRCYLEILAPVGPAKPSDDSWSKLAHAAHEPRVLTYCLRSARALFEISAIATGFGWKNTGAAPNGRNSPDGTRLTWQWLGMTVEKFGLGLPFFIDWRDSPHPAETIADTEASGAIRLRHFAVGHPAAAELQQVLTELGSPIETYVADALQFKVQLETPRGTVAL